MDNTISGALKKKIGGIILAAGSSSRLGMPKQLVMMEGKSLIRRVCEEAILADFSGVVVVTGANAERVAREIADLPVQTVFNGEWEEGMASSIRKGLTVSSLSGLDAAMILLCDQVKLTADLLREISHTYLEGDCKMVYCSYGSQIGVPALFDKTIFPELMKLKGDIGAKSIIKRHLAQGKNIPFPGGETDIDNPWDMEGLG